MPSLSPQPANQFNRALGEISPLSTNISLTINDPKLRNLNDTAKGFSGAFPIASQPVENPHRPPHKLPSVAENSKAASQEPRRSEPFSSLPVGRSSLDSNSTPGDLPPSEAVVMPYASPNNGPAQHWSA